MLRTARQAILLSPESGRRVIRVNDHDYTGYVNPHRSGRHSTVSGSDALAQDISTPRVSHLSKFCGIRDIFFGFISTPSKAKHRHFFTLLCWLQPSTVPWCLLLLHLRWNIYQLPKAHQYQRCVSGLRELHYRRSSESQTQGQQTLG